MANKLTVDKSNTGTQASAFALPNKTVRLVPVIKRDRFMGVTDHDGSFMFTGCSQSFVLPYSSRMKRLIEPLTKEERVYLESELKLNLDINQKDNFYFTHRIEIKKVSTDLASLYLEFNLANPLDYLEYKILLKVPVVAPTWAERNANPMYEWALQDLGEEFEQKVSLGELKQRAYTHMNKIVDSKSALYDLIRVYGKNVSENASIDEMKSMLYDIIETPKTLRQLTSVLKDKDFEHKLFLDKAVRLGQIVRKGTTKYALVSGDVIGNTLRETIDFIKDRGNDVIVQSIRDQIEINKV